ncbi:MAG: selenide, water dikinase SelD, partial [Pseudomonadota bacterium]
MAPLPGARLTVINPDVTAPYTGMLPGHVAGHYPREALEIDLVRLCRFAGARLVLGRADGIERDARNISVEDHPDIRYDIASIDIGITSGLPGVPGFSDHAVPAKPLGAFAKAWEARIAEVAAGAPPPKICVIGAGVGGVELALAMHHRLTLLGHEEPSIHIVDRSAALPGLGGDARAVLFERLRAADIRLHEKTRVKEVSATEVYVENDRPIPSTFTVGTAGARPHGWLAELGLEHEKGFLTVDAHLRSVSDSAIYAVGDCAHLGFAPRPKAGVFAVRQAPILHHNFRADLTGQERRAFKPQKRFLKLISLGGKDALAEGYGLTPSGPWLWRLKDRIDVAFMDKLAKLPAMPAPTLPKARAEGVAHLAEGQPPCAGCGAKVSSQTLDTVLRGLPAPKRQDVASLPGDDAALLRIGGAEQVITTDHLRAFTDDPVTFARLAAIHALGDIWAMGAQPQAALANVTLPYMAAPMQASTLRDVMESLAQVMRREGADLVGGHTTNGAEFTIGLTITGLVDGKATGLEGAAPGDALVLTKPIGSGTILAADMQALAPGDVVQAAFETMGMGQSRAASLLSLVATAMTDVTGFGLAGHLLRLCKASGTGAQCKT